MKLQILTRDSNREFLLGRFLARLLERAPSSALDVGTGRGDLLRLAAGAGLPMVGLDRAGPALEALAARGWPVHTGRAEALPFEEGAFEWVTLRHVLHHFDDPRRALAEALRVARVGVLAAEPWYDLALESQAVGYRIDQWLRTDDRRRGMVHGPGFGPAELCELALAAAPGARVELETWLRPGVEDPSELRARVEERLADPHVEQTPDLAELLERAETVGAGLGGSAVVLVTQPT